MAVPAPRDAALKSLGLLCRSLLILVIAAHIAPPQRASGDETVAAAAEVGDAVPDSKSLRFSFSGASWREVLSWLADESGMALHVGDAPPGSFTYSDPNTFSTNEAIARVNLFLIPQGYAVVRRDTLLSVISLGDPRSLQQLDALATLVPVEELEQRSDHEVVKCIFPLGDIAADEATTELRPLMLMQQPVILPRSNQLVVTETAMKLRSVAAILRAMEAPQTETEVVRRFDLKHTDFDSVMIVARSHLGIGATGSTSAELSLSSDATGKRVFASGLTERVDRLAELLTVIDVPGDATPSTASMVLRSHVVTGDNLQAVYDVLQTILAGRSLRLSMQPTTSSIVALADADSHQEIERTIEELQAPAVEFAVIQLNSLDPYFVVTLIGEMFEARPLPTPTRTSSSSSRSREDLPEQTAAPRVDADPGNRQLFVRGTSEQVRQIRQMVDSLDTKSSGGDAVRVLPLPMQNRQQVLEAASQFWRGRNRLQILPAGDFEQEGFDVIERAINPDPPLSAGSHTDVMSKPDSAGLPNVDTSVNQSAHAIKALVSVNAEDSDPPQITRLGRASEAPIRSRLIPEGILIESDDLDALDQFQDHLMEIAAMRSRSPSPPVVYYLKYVSADDAVKMLADLLDGGNSLAETPAGTLINGSSMAMASRGYFGSSLNKREGMVTVTAGTATIVSDARLNRLIVQGTADDVALIEGYLKIIDKGNSLNSIETSGRSRVIELVNSKASEVAEAVKQAFAGRVAREQGGSQAGSQRTPTDSRQTDSRQTDSRQTDSRQSISDFDRLRSTSASGQRDVVEKPTRGRQPEMTVAVHEPSNSIIITAPDSLFFEVENLVRAVDRRSEQSIEVIPAAAGVDMESILRMLGTDGRTSSRSPSSSSSSSSSRSSGSR